MVLRLYSCRVYSRTALFVFICLTLSAQVSRGEDRIPRAGLDDTGGFIHLMPSVQTALACSEITVAIRGTFTNARVFGLRFYFETARLDLLSVTPGAAPSLHILPESLVVDTLNLDGYFHPNFSGTTTLATLHLYVKPVAHDETALIGFFFGQGFSGPAEWPEPIDFSGDTATIFIEGTPPLPPSHLLITPMDGDSVRLQWHPVYYDADGDTVINPRYVLFLTDVKNMPADTDSVCTTMDTTLYNDFVKYTFDPDSALPYDSIVVNQGVYQVRSRKTQP